ncbi:hypothetical protein BWO91_01130 [Plantibacter flavus]|nr:hypothetical protein BWO91_01130 [Plantibacter flavus]
MIDGERSSHSGPRTPAGPSDSTMARRPIFSSGTVVQKSAPETSATFSSRSSRATRASIAAVSTGFVAACRGVVMVMRCGSVLGWPFDKLGDRLWGLGDRWWVGLGNRMVRPAARFLAPADRAVEATVRRRTPPHAARR